METRVLLNFGLYAVVWKQPNKSSECPVNWNWTVYKVYGSKTSDENSVAVDSMLPHHCLHDCLKTIIVLIIIAFLTLNGCMYYNYNYTFICT